MTADMFGNGGIVTKLGKCDDVLIHLIKWYIFYIEQLKMCPRCSQIMY